MRRLRCLIDLDGVLSNFCKGALALHDRKDLELAPGEWHFNHQMGLSAEAFFAPMDRKFWSSLEPLEECVPLVRLCEQMFDAPNCFIVTGLCHTEGCAEGKQDWIAKHLPAYIHKNAKTIGPKAPYVTSPHAVLLDDSDETVDQVNAEGGNAILVPRLWNSRHRERGELIEKVEAELSEFLRQQRRQW